MRWYLILIGGALGSGARYLTAVVTVSRFGAEFPWGTLAVNVVGSFLIGVVATLADESRTIGPETRAFLLVGVLGGFTTFSSFSMETVRLVEGNQTAHALVNVGANLILAISATVLAIALTRSFAR